MRIRIYQNDTPGIIPSILNYTILDDTEIIRFTCTLENTSEPRNDDAFAQIKYRHHVNVVFSVICFNYLYQLSQS